MLAGTRTDRDHPPVQPIIARKYLLRRRIAEGGMGEVWLARNQRTHGDCAIKILLPELARSGEAMARFAREARATGQLKHPGIIQVFDAGKTEDGRPYLVMELLVGESLEQRLARQGPMSPGEACVLLSQVARSLQHAHQMGVVHRDLSASNVFLVRSREGGAPTPKIVDFGVSKLLGARGGGCTLSGTLLGSPAYMSPEQAEGAEGVDARTDVWSLGVLLYQSLSARMPFDERNANATMLAIVSRPHVPLLEWAPELDRELGALVEGCLVKDRSERVQTAMHVADSLERIGRRLLRSRNESSLTPRRRLTDRLPPAPIRQAPMPRRVRRAPGPLWLALGTGVLGIVIGVLIGAKWGGEMPRKPTANRVRAAARVLAPERDIPRAETGRRAEVRSGVRRLEELPRESDVDLARAVAEGLGVERR